MEINNPKLTFGSDYMEGAHPSILARLNETNLMQTPGYGADIITKQAQEKIQKACGSPNAAVHFFVGGTQTNLTVIDGLLSSYQGVISADTGHINVHEAGAIEHGGHKVIPLRNHFGKLNATDIQHYLKDFYADEAYEHMVIPGMVYVSQPTEYGTLYSLKELEDIHQVCIHYKLPLYIDGARLAYGLAAKENDVTLKDLARLSDVFYIGGTKCGTLFGEALVIPNPTLIPHFFNIMKQHGAVLAKGRLLGVQFDALFSDDLYRRIGEAGMKAAHRIKTALIQFGYTLFIDSPTNQIFVTLCNEHIEALKSHVTFGFWQKLDEDLSVVRFVTSWATTDQQVDQLIDLLKKMAPKQSK